MSRYRHLLTVATIAFSIHGKKIRPLPQILRPFAIYLQKLMKCICGSTSSCRPVGNGRIPHAHPHLIYFLTNANDAYKGPAVTHLTLYVEPHNGKLRLAATDIENANEPHGLTQGPLVGGYNGKAYDSQQVLFGDGTWYCVEAMFKLNSLDFPNDSPNADGQLRAWVNNQLVIEETDVVFRTTDFPDMKFNQLLVSPYFGDGLLPHAQALWIDDVAVGTKRIGPATGGNTNDPPTITSTPVTTATEDTAYSYDVNASDPDVGDTLTYSLVTKPSGMSINATTGVISWTPTNAQVGGNAVMVRVRDAALAEGTQSFTITVANTNDPPTASNDSYSVNKNGTLTVPAAGVLSNDGDIDGDSLTAVRVTNPSHGSLTLNANGSFTYTPAANFTGSDAFTYKARDGAADSNVATVSITINADQATWLSESFEGTPPKGWSAYWTDVW